MKYLELTVVEDEKRVSKRYAQYLFTHLRMKLGDFLEEEIDALWKALKTEK